MVGLFLCECISPYIDAIIFDYTICQTKETHKSVKACNSSHRTLSLQLLHKCSKIISFLKRIFIYIE